MKCKKKTLKEKARQIENESKTDRESMQEKERKWLGGKSDDKCRENKQ